jgi:hypothetical protein
MHSEDIKIVDLVKEHLKTKEKTRMRGGRGRVAPSSTQIYFMRSEV